MTLDELAILHGTDKSSKHHNYCVVYEKYFGPLRYKPIVLWECGSGGYHYPDRGFNGAMTWRDYFSDAKIISVDIHHKDPVPAGIKFYRGSQNDKLFWDTLAIVESGNPDIFIDDASHINDLTVQTFKIVWPMLKPGGIYVIEDLESSWWEDIASDGTDFGGKKDPYDLHSETAINMLRLLVNTVNNIQPDVGIESIHFHRNIAFIIKK